MKIVLMIIGVLALAAISSIINGYALSVLWGWFVAPTFELPTLGIAQAIGIALVVTFLTHQYTDEDDKEFSEKIGHAISASVLKPLIYLLIGWIAFQFM